MFGRFIKRTGTAIAACTLLFLQQTVLLAQTPEIPPQVSFGGITVKFDRGAQNIIEEDIRALMGNKKFWEEKLDRAILHFPIVEGILMDEEVPIDFKYLAVQESSFKPDVVSSSNAVGYWQFKPETAISLNLRVDDDIDERKNISSSTHAAAWYLKKSNQQFNNWVSALYSYYLGAGGVKKLVPTNWAYAREVTLNAKTDRYMLRFFAHKIALEAGIEKHRTNNKITLLESDYGKGRSLDQVARELGVSASELKSFNRWLPEGEIPTDREYLIAVPVPNERLAEVRQKLSLPVTEITNTNIARSDNGFPVLKKSATQLKGAGAPVLYDINGLSGVEARPGDKPKALAEAGRLRTPRFMKYNDMLRDMPLIPGKVYYLAKKNKIAATPYHTAQPGDTWHSVSQQYGIRLVSLLKYNRTISRNYPIQTGQVLWLTKKRPKNQPVEIISPDPKQAPVQPVKEPEVVANKTTQPAATAQQQNDIPTNPSGRKKYTPVLVDKNESSIAKEDKSFEPAATPVATTTPAAKTAPTATKSKPAASTSEPSNIYRNSNDRVVIITQDGGDSSFKSGEPEKNPTAVKSGPKTAQTTPAPTRTPVKETPKEVASAAVEKPAPAKPVVEEVRKPAATTSGSAFHTVEKGQTYFSVSKLYNLSVKELLDLNDLTEKDKLSVGQSLRVQKKAAEPETKYATSSKNTAGPIVHTVVSGETLFRISKNYEVEIEDIKKLNNMSGNSVQLGQKLKIPQKN